MLNGLIIGLFGVFVAYNLRFKQLPFSLGIKFRKVATFKPLSCFYCLSIWSGISSWLFFLFIQAFSSNLANLLIEIYGICGVALLFYLFISNWCPADLSVENGEN